MAECPNDPAYCRCVEHHQGLRAHAADKDAFDAALAKAQGGLRLRVVTGLGLPGQPVRCRYEDAYLCDFDGCVTHPAPPKQWQAPARLPDPPATRALPERQAA